MKSADMCVFCSQNHRKPRERRMARETDSLVTRVLHTPRSCCNPSDGKVWLHFLMGCYNNTGK